MSVQNDDLQVIAEQLREVIYKKQKGDYVGAAQQIIGLAKAYPLDEKNRYYNVIVYYMDLLDYLIQANGKIDDGNMLIRMKIIDYYYTISYEAIPEDIKAPLEYIIIRNVEVFPDEELQEYFEKSHPIIDYDEKVKLYYILHDGKKLFFDEGPPEKIAFTYRFICMEQHINSPHRYVTGDFDVKEGDVVLDVGAAEANFSLGVVERSSELYVFEADEKWQKALEATFRPWKEKVRVISKFASNQSDECSVTIDEIVGDNQVDFIKLDVEGAELAVLKGADKTLRQNPGIKVAVCTYHKINDAEEIKAYLEDMGFDVEFSKGYVLASLDALAPPYFRRGLIRAVRKDIL